MNIGPEAEQELMEAVKKADEQGRSPPPDAVEIRLPAEVVQAIEKDVQEYRINRFYEAAMAQTQPDDVLVWDANEPAPPEHTAVQPPRTVIVEGADKYHGDIAAGYRAKREQQPKFHEEQRIIEDMLSDLPPETLVLDCPVGEGRFLRFYEEHGFNAVCVDKSEDMLSQAVAVGSTIKNQYAVGDIRDLKMDDKSVDVSVMVRMTRWLSPEDCRKAMSELRRVTRSRIILTARVRSDKTDRSGQPVARPYELFTGDGWKISRDEFADGEDYRVIMLEPE